jgi:hypothetical protein
MTDEAGVTPGDTVLFRAERRYAYPQAKGLSVQ